MLAAGDVTFVVFWKTDPSEFVCTAFMSVVVDSNILILHVLNLFVNAVHVYKAIGRYRPSFICINSHAKRYLGNVKTPVR
jgi:hypothetical protein